MLFPKKVKYRKSHKGRSRGQLNATSKTTVSFGTFGLKALGSIWVTARQIESCRRVMSRCLKSGGKIWIRVFPDKPVTKKGEQTTLGGGKGPVDHYVCIVKPGMILFEIGGTTEEIAKKTLHLAHYKLGVPTRVVKKIV